ncbi:MAG: GNAT family N-acetyltransferase [Leptolyngbya sp. SIO1D8]|nr:GNAT family N-acetyltransferase [Leptolyngbya sp. SIO1D8]
MAAQNYTIRTMTRNELDLAVDWAASEGWNPGLYDADCFYAADPNGFLLGVLDEDPIACISVVKYDVSFGFLGFYIVKPAFRGMGYGLQIWKAGLDYLKGCNIGLDGVVAQQENYLKSGFKLAYRNIRYEGISDGMLVPTNPNLIPLTSPSIDTVIAYDRLFFPSDRAQFLKCWLTQPESKAIGLMHHQTLAGYGMLRRCRSGYKIGPLFADTPQFAEDIFLALKSTVESGSPFYLDVPESNPLAIALAERHHMHSMFETARMYTQQPPELPLDRLFGVTTFELG